MITIINIPLTHLFPLLIWVIAPIWPPIKYPTKSASPKGITTKPFIKRNIVVISTDIAQGNLCDALAFIYVVPKKYEIIIYFKMPKPPINPMKKLEIPKTI